MLIDFDGVPCDSALAVEHHLSNVNRSRGSGRNGDTRSQKEGYVPLIAHPLKFPTTYLFYREYQFAGCRMAGSASRSDLIAQSDL